MRIESNMKRLAVVATLALTAFSISCDRDASVDEPDDPAETSKVEPEPAEPADVRAGETAADQTEGRDAMGGRPTTFAPVVEKSRPAVVNIYTTTELPARRYLNLPGGRLIPGKRRAESLGSGFIVDPNGLVLTNWHVVQKATDIEVRLFDDRRFEANVVGFDPKTDVALLQLAEAAELPWLDFADSEELLVGDWVVAIGNPLGLTSTVTAGIVSATGRKSLPLGGEMMYQDFIQTDASINPGNSGGPLLDLDGDVVGINTAVHAEGQGLGFAIPVNMVVEIMPRLKEGGRVERGWLGVYIDPVPTAVRSQLGLADGGVLITRVVRGGPADKAGLRPGDIVLAMDEEAVPGPDELAWMAGNVGVGKEITLEIRRGDVEKVVPVVLGSLPQ